MSHDRERRRKSKGHEAPGLDGGKSEGEEEGKVAAAEVGRNKPGLTIWFGERLRADLMVRDQKKMVVIATPQTDIELVSKFCCGPTDKLVIHNYLDHRNSLFFFVFFCDNTRLVSISTLTLSFLIR